MEFYIDRLIYILPTKLSYYHFSSNIILLTIILEHVVPVVNLADSLDSFQSDKQRLVLDTVAQIRKCSLEAILPLP